MMAEWSSKSSSGSTAESTDGASVSCFLEEENLIDCLFYNCDVKRTGKVRVYELLEYLLNITSTGEDSKERMELLLDIMDPDRCDPEIDIDTYRRCTAIWIDLLNHDTRCDTSETLNDTTVVFSNSVPSSPVKQSPFVNRFLQLNITSQSSHLISPLKPVAANNRGILSPVVSSPSLDGSPDVDSGCLRNRIADLEFRNRFLSEEVSSLKEQLEQSEDALAALSQEKDKLKSEIKSHLLTIERLQEVMVENEELKATLAASEASKSQLQKELDTLERDHHALEKAKESLLNELFEAQEELCKMQEERHAITEYKIICQNTMKKEEEQASKLALKHAEVDELRSVVADVSALNESLRKEMKDLQLYLAETAQGKTQTMQLSVIAEEMEDSIVSENEEQIPITLIPDSTSTPAPRSSSIWKELEQSLLTDAPCVPSPLCDKEMDNILLTNIKPLILDMSLTVSPEVKLADESDSSNRQVNITGDKEYLLKHVAEAESSHLVAALAQDDKLDQIAERISRLVYEKLAAEQKVQKYCAVLHKLHDLFKVKEAQHLESEQALEAKCKSLLAEVDNLKQILLEEKKKNELKEQFEVDNRALVLTGPGQNTLSLESDVRIQQCHQTRLSSEQIESIEHSATESLADDYSLSVNNNNNNYNNNSNTIQEVSKISDLVPYTRNVQLVADCQHDDAGTDNTPVVQLFAGWQTIFTYITVGLLILLGIFMLLLFVVLMCAVVSGADDLGLQQYVELRHIETPPF